MKKLKKLLLSYMLITLAINLVGCAKVSKGEDTNKESIEQSANVEDTTFVDKIIKTRDNKYIVAMPEDLGESMTLGHVYYFNNDNITMKYIPIYDTEDLTYEYISTDKGEDSLTFNILSKCNGTEEPMTFKIMRHEDGILRYRLGNENERALELLEKEEVEQVLRDNYDLFNLSSATYKFYNDFDLDMDKLSSTSNNVDNSSSQENTSQVKNYANKEDAIKRVKEIISPVGVRLCRTDEIVTTTYEGRKCWEFYIAHGEAAIEFLYLDINTGEFKESINIGSDWRYQW